ncbi:conserved hypothetical protein [Burkholderiales bacterium 8X]|nr:conserved hypothetical protein [Burkholderiales bacterium 8X]
MKVLNLQCGHGHGFEGWFASNEAFERQLAGALVECPMCGDTEIIKLLTAPRLNLGSAKRAEGEGQAEQAGQAGQPNAQGPASVPNATTGSPGTQVSLEARWMMAVREVLSKTEDVGKRFATEARKMHYGEADERGIRGQATPEEAKSLAEEGIAVFTLPIPPALKGTLQ